MRSIRSNPIPALLVVAAVFAALPAGATTRVYRCPGDKGVPEYTDQPCKAGAAIEIDAGKPRADASAALQRDRDALDRSMEEWRARDERERMAREAYAQEAQNRAGAEDDYGGSVAYLGGGYGYWNDVQHGTHGGRIFRRNHFREHFVPDTPRNPRLAGSHPQHMAPPPPMVQPLGGGHR